MADYSLVQSPEQPNKFFSPDYGWLTPAQPNPPDKKRAVPITRAPAFVDALSPGGAFYRHNPDRATRELEELQQREMTRVSQIETMSPGMGVGYWNESPIFWNSAGIASLLPLSRTCLILPKPRA